MESLNFDGFRQLREAIAQGGGYEHRVDGEDLPDLDMIPILPQEYVAVHEIDVTVVPGGNVRPVDFRS